MVNSYGQKPMEKPWIITHGDFMEFFCKGGGLSFRLLVDCHVRTRLTRRINSGSTLPAGVMVAR